ncbi:MAG: cyclic nucleotide-binding domain-containing protein [Actinomycetota bacterium]
MFRRTDPVPAALRATAIGATLPDAELRALVHRGTLVRLGADRQLMTENGLGREVALVLSGGVIVERHGQVVARLGAGEIVGEMAVIAGVPRNADVTTSEESELYVFSRGEFAALLDSCPALNRYVHVGAVQRGLAG